MCCHEHCVTNGGVISVLTMICLPKGAQRVYDHTPCHSASTATSVFYALLCAFSDSLAVLNSVNLPYS